MRTINNVVGPSMCRFARARCRSNAARVCSAVSGIDVARCMTVAVRSISCMRAPVALAPESTRRDRCRALLKRLRQPQRHFAERTPLCGAGDSSTDGDRRRSRSPRCRVPGRESARRFPVTLRRVRRQRGDERAADRGHRDCGECDQRFCLRGVDAHRGCSRQKSGVFRTSRSSCSIRATGEARPIRQQISAVGGSSQTPRRGGILTIVNAPSRIYVTATSLWRPTGSRGAHAPAGRADTDRGPYALRALATVIGSSPGYAVVRIVVRVAPGFSVVTRTRPSSASSSASTCANPSTANFEAAYAPQYARPARPTLDEVITTDASVDRRSAGSTRLRQQEHRLDVDLHDAPPARRVVELDRHTRPEHARVVQQSVETAVVFDDLLVQLRIRLARLQSRGRTARWSDRYRFRL